MDIHRVTEEMDRLTAAIDTNTYHEQHNKLFAARQALYWAINPDIAASPYASIMGILEAREGCLDEPCPPQS